MKNSFGKRMFLSKMRDIGVVEPLNTATQAELVNVNRYNIPAKTSCAVSIPEISDKAITGAKIYEVKETIFAERGDLDRTICMSTLDIGVDGKYFDFADTLRKTGQTIEVNILTDKSYGITGGKQSYTYTFTGKITDAKVKYRTLRITLESTVNGFRQT